MKSPEELPRNCCRPGCQRQVAMSLCLFRHKRFLGQYAVCKEHGDGAIRFLHAGEWVDGHDRRELKEVRECDVVCLALDASWHWGAVVLRECGGAGAVAIRTEPLLVWSLSAAMTGERRSRPTSHEAMAMILRQLEVELVRAVVYGLIEGVYRAQLVLRTDGREAVVDAMPSDAIHLAHLEGSPIYVGESLLARGATDPWAGHRRPLEGSDIGPPMCAFEGCVRHAAMHVIFGDRGQFASDVVLCAEHGERLLITTRDSARGARDQAAMTQGDTPMTIEYCVVEPGRSASRLGLRESNGSRRLEIPSGAFEGNALEGALRGSSRVSRPCVHATMARVLQEFGAAIDRVVVDKVFPAEGVFHAKVHITKGAAHVTVDARPSDAIILATIAQAPILVSEGVVRMAGE